MKKLLLVLLTLLSVSPTFAQGLNDLSKEESDRRGNFVVSINGKKSTEEQLISEAFAPPADDSNKWYFTLVTMKDCPPCDKLKRDLAASPDLRCWVHVEDSKTSPMHYQVRSVEDQTQDDWFKGVKERINKMGVPCVVIQPPSNGKFGEPKTVVGILAGYDGKTKEYSKRINRAIEMYVRSLSKQRLVMLTETEQRTAPFAVPSSNPVLNPGVPSPVQTMPSQTLTLAEIKALIPEAPADFILDAVLSSPTDPQLVQLQWQVYKAKKDAEAAKIKAEEEAKKPVPPPVVSPDKEPVTPKKDSSENSSPFSLSSTVSPILTSILVSILTAALVYWRTSRKTSGQPAFLTEDQFSELLKKIAQKGD